MAALIRPPPLSGRPIVSDESPAGFSGKQLGAIKLRSSPLKSASARNAHLRIIRAVEGEPTSAIEASKEPSQTNQKRKGHERRRLEEKYGLDPFEELKDRFLCFKKKNYVENLIHYQNLAEVQAPTVVSQTGIHGDCMCGLESMPFNCFGVSTRRSFYSKECGKFGSLISAGASETTAALEFAVNSLEVPNILVVGHSRCGGIRALMSMKDEAKSRSFIRDWVFLGKSARLSTEAAAGNLSFEDQCRHCEKESINGSLLNLLTYPWIERRLTEGTLSLHGGYYDFVNCTFEKWTLVYRKGLEGGSKYSIRNHSLWS